MARKPASAPAINLSNSTAWKHQQETLSFLDGKPRAFDNSDAGTGKTYGQIKHYERRVSPGRALVLCPKTLMETAWQTDVEKFAPGISVSLAYAEQREEAFKMNTDMVVMNVDGVKWLADKKNQHLLKGFDHLIVDEYTAYKSSTSQRSKAVAAIRKHFKHRYGLSATPNPNSVMELWHPALLIDDGARLGTSYFKLRAAVQTPTQVGPSANHVRWDDKPGIATAVAELLRDITIRHAFEDVMTHVPPNHRNTKAFQLSKRAKSAYDKMENDCILALESDTITAVHAASLRNKLLQIASGAVYNGNEEGSYTVIDATRYELIGDLVEGRQHSVVFFNWKHQRELLSAEFKKRGISFALIDGSVTKGRGDIVRRYQEGEFQTILLHPRTGAHGLTLTQGDTTIFSSPIYEADLMKQGLARIYRGVQDKVTNTVFVEAAHTVEHEVYERLNGKYERMEDLLSQMKHRRGTK